MAAIASETRMSAEIRALLKKAKGNFFNKSDTKAQFNLGNAFYFGRGVTKNKRQAVEWYRKAAEQGYAKAQLSLGGCFLNGRGVAKDDRLAVEWYRKAAEQGLASAQCNLGLCLEDGRGVAKDERRAVEWYRKAAEQGYAKAQYSLGACFACGRGVAKSDDRLSMEWYRKAAEQGYAKAQYSLGARFEDGRGVAKDERQAAEWYRKAAQQGLASALFHFGWMLEQGRGVAKDEQQAMEWYRKAAEQRRNGKVKIVAQRELRRLQFSGVTSEVLELLQKQLKETPFSAEELQDYQQWSKEVSVQLSTLTKRLAETQRKLGHDAKTQAEQTYIDSHPKLKQYQKRLQMEFSCFVTSYFLTPAGILKLDDNKRDMMITGISHIPKKAVEGIPFIGPLLSSSVSAIESSLHSVNKKYRLNQINRLKELFKGLDEIAQVSYEFARLLTLAKEDTIQNQREVQYEGLAKIKSFYRSIKQSLNKLRQDLVTSDTTGITLKAEEELAVLDCAYVLHQILSGEAAIDMSGNLTSQFIEIVTGEPRKPQTLIFAASPADSVAATMHLKPTVTVASPQSPLSPISEADLKAMQEQLKRQRMEFEAHKRAQEEENKKLREKVALSEESASSMAEKLAKFQKQLQPTEVVGGAEVMDFARPDAFSDTSKYVSYAEFHTLRQQVTLTSQRTEETVETVAIVSRAVYDLQDKSKTDRNRTGKKHMQLAQFEAMIDETTREAAESKKVKTAGKKPVGIDSLV